MNILHTHPGYSPSPPCEVTLCDDLAYENSDFIVRVYRGYRCDGGSIPRVSWSLLGITPYDPRCVYAFFLHDFLYQSELLTRKQADYILAEVLAIPPCCNAVQRWLIWSHVRAYGWIVWRNHTPTTVMEGRKFGEVVKKNKLNKTVIKTPEDYE